MSMRSSRSTVTFSNPFTLPGYPGDLPAGDYEVLVEEELLQGLSFEAYRRTATYLTVRGRGMRWKNRAFCLPHSSRSISWAWRSGSEL